MPIHNFEFDNSMNPRKMVDQQFTPRNPNREIVEPTPSMPELPVAVEAQSREDMWFERQNVNIAEEVREILPQGYRTIDRGIKNYFSGIQIPTKDGARIMQVRISGGDKAYLVWAQDLKRGRVQLPLMSITRTNAEFNPMKFSPPHFHYMAKRFLDPSGTKIALAYRPVPAIINYTLSIWAEHKRDLEYALYQINTRFNPVAEFLVEDEHLRSSVFMKYEGWNASTEDELPADQIQKKRYDYNISVEGHLPLPEKVVPSVLGRVINMREGTQKVPSGDVLAVIAGKGVLNTAQIR
jgi:hypothetical protein